MPKITWSRVVMNREIDRLVHAIASWFDKLNMLEISGSRWTVEGDGGEYFRINYPEHDICKTKLTRKFNLIIAEMVFEHLPYPHQAGKNVYDMLDMPGFFVISVPFMYPMHNHPVDCTRWTPTGLHYFLHECGFDFEQIYTDSWGNRDYVMAHTDRPIDYEPEIHSLENDPAWPVAVWAVAQK